MTGAPSATRGATGVAAAAPTSVGGGSAPGDEKAGTGAVAIPAFAGYTLPDTTSGLVALLGIVLVTSLAAWLTAGSAFGARAPVIAGVFGGGSSGPPTTATRPPTWALAALWFGVVATGAGLVVYQLGPTLEQRDQHELISEYRTTVRQAANEGSGLPGVAEVTKPPTAGAAVGVLEIAALRRQSVVVEGATPSETRRGPGHVPGTAGLGQPGNSVVVARRNGYGGTFADLDELQKGRRILVTTTQGQSVYTVRSVRTVKLVESVSSDQTKDLAGKKIAAPDGTSDAYRNRAQVSVDTLYGPTDDDRLTLVTSASRAFWNTSDAVVVVAKMDGTPFQPTPQGARSDSETGRHGESGVWPSIVLAVLLYGAAVVASIALYRRMHFRVAYALTVAPLVALTVITGETLSRLLPAWM
jgi:sortase A